MVVMLCSLRWSTPRGFDPAFLVALAMVDLRDRESPSSFSLCNTKSERVSNSNYLFYFFICRLIDHLYDDIHKMILYFDVFWRWMICQMVKGNPIHTLLIQIGCPHMRSTSSKPVPRINRNTVWILQILLLILGRLTMHFVLLRHYGLLGLYQVRYPMDFTQLFR